MPTVCCTSPTAHSNKSLNTYGAYWAVDFGVSGGGFSLDGNVLSYGGYRLSMWTDSSGSRWVYANTKSIYTPLTVEFENVMVAHVFVLMLENRSFDNIFGRSGIPGLTVAPDDATNKWGTTTYPVKKGAPPALTGDPGHEFLDTFEHLCGHGQQWTSGQNYPAINNSGYVSNYATTTSEELPIPTSDHFGDVMAMFDTPKQLPVIHTLATEYAICDHWFSSMPGPTWPNRFFVHAGTSGGLRHSLQVRTGVVTNQGLLVRQRHHLRRHQEARPRVHALQRHGRAARWVVVPAGVRARRNMGHRCRQRREPRQGPPRQLPLRLHLHRAELRRRAAQHLRWRFVPASRDGMHNGEALIKRVYEAIRNSPHWNTSVLIVTYDEHGGFYDSVVPPRNVPAPARQKKSPPDQAGCDFRQLGVRVPAVVVSPWIPKGTVDHTQYDHTSVLRTIENLFGISSLTARDAAANDVLALLSLPAVRPDCMTTLPDPVPDTPPAAPLVAAMAPAPAADEPLPQTGNIHGFIALAAKAHLEMAEGDPVATDAIHQTLTGIETWGRHATICTPYRLKKVAHRPGARAAHTGAHRVEDRAARRRRRRSPTTSGHDDGTGPCSSAARGCGLNDAAGERAAAPSPDDQQRARDHRPTSPRDRRHQHTTRTQRLLTESRRAFRVDARIPNARRKPLSGPSNWASSKCRSRTHRSAQRTPGGSSSSRHRTAYLWSVEPSSGLRFSVEVGQGRRP